MELNLKRKEDCKFDLVSLGEVMLRFEPGDMRIKNTRSFRVWEGGGEYNVARALRKVFLQRTAIVTALADNEVGKLIEDLMLQGGVDTSFVKWYPYDDFGKNVRNGFNFTERGFGLRGALSVYDRAGTAPTKLKKGDIDWEYLFGELGVRWFHTGGIFAALSENSAELLLDGVKTAKKYGTVVSYDLNYRNALWKDIGGKERARLVNREIAKYIDVMIGNEQDFSDCLGYDNTSNGENGHESYYEMMQKAAADYPNFKAAAATLHKVKSATVNDWSAVCYADGKMYDGLSFKDLEIYDCIGGGDAFAAGFIYSLLNGGDPQKAVNCGVAHGALKMTSPGDSSMTSLAEVEGLMSGLGAKIKR